MGKAITGVFVIIFDAILTLAWFSARTAAAQGHGPAPSPVKYGIAAAFSALVLLALLFSGGRRTSSSSRNGGSRGGSGYSSWSGR